MPIDFAEPTPKLSPSETTGCTIPLSRIHLLIKDKEIAEYDEGTGCVYVGAGRFTVPWGSVIKLPGDFCLVKADEIIEGADRETWLAVRYTAAELDSSSRKV